jgi:hypothetical protein
MSTEVLTQISLQFRSSKPMFNMFMFKKSKLGLLPLAQENKENDETFEREAMLNHEHVESRPRSRSQRVWSSNVPWIITTMALSLYILISAPSLQKNHAPWSPTDVGKFFPMTKVGNTLG